MSINCWPMETVVVVVLTVAPPPPQPPHARATKIQAVSTFAFRMSLPFMEQGGRVARRHVNTVAFVGNSHAQ
jgi:hypothetical protein